MSLPKSGLVLILAALALCACVVAAQKVEGPTLDPSEILTRIDKVGPRAAAGELGDKGWTAVLRNIEGGSETWIKVATALYAGTDAGLSEMLTTAMGRALAVAPREVLAIAGSTVPVEAICGYPDMTDPRTDSQGEVAEYLGERLKAVSRLSGDEGSSVRLQCLEVLRKTKDEVGGQGGPFKQP